MPVWRNFNYIYSTEELAISEDLAVNYEGLGQTLTWKTEGMAMRSGVHSSWGLFFFGSDGPSSSSSASSSPSSSSPASFSGSSSSSSSALASDPTFSYSEHEERKHSPSQSQGQLYCQHWCLAQCSDQTSSSATKAAISKPWEVLV